MLYFPLFVCNSHVVQCRYFVVDSAEALQKFGQDAWDRVVCVMTTGQAWQFKPYKWSDPKVLFHHGKGFIHFSNPFDSRFFAVKGFYVSLTSDPPNTKIKDWNVTELKVSAYPVPSTSKLTGYWPDRREPATRRQVGRRAVLEDTRCVVFG